MNLTDLNEIPHKIQYITIDSVDVKPHTGGEPVRERHVPVTLDLDLYSNIHFEGMSQAKNEVDKLCRFHDYDFRKYKGKQVLNKIARNLVDYEAGRTILETVLGIVKKSNIKQTELF